MFEEIEILCVSYTDCDITDKDTGEVKHICGSRVWYRRLINDDQSVLSGVEPQKYWCEGVKRDDLKAGKKAKIYYGVKSGKIKPVKIDPMT